MRFFRLILCWFCFSFGFKVLFAKSVMMLFGLRYCCSVWLKDIISLLRLFLFVCNGILLVKNNFHSCFKWYEYYLRYCSSASMGIFNWLVIFDNVYYCISFLLVAFCYILETLQSFNIHWIISFKTFTLHDPLNGFCLKWYWVYMVNHFFCRFFYHDML